MLNAGTLCYVKQHDTMWCCDGFLSIWLITTWCYFALRYATLLFYARVSITLGPLWAVLSRATSYFLSDLPRQLHWACKRLALNAWCPFWQHLASPRPLSSRSLWESTTLSWEDLKTKRWASTPGPYGPSVLAECSSSYRTAKTRTAVCAHLHKMNPFNAPSFPTGPRAFPTIPCTMGYGVRYKVRARVWGCQPATTCGHATGTRWMQQDCSAIDGFPLLFRSLTSGCIHLCNRLPSKSCPSLRFYYLRFIWIGTDIEA